MELKIIDSFRKEYGFLSNYTLSPFTLNNVYYPTVEHAFQAQKTFDKEEQQRISECSSPSNAKWAGRQVRLRPDWDIVKDDIMLACLRYKFQNPVLSQLLLDTGDATLIEGNTWNDTYWGICNGIGKNMLGKLLMQVRSEVKERNVNESNK